MLNRGLKLFITFCLLVFITLTIGGCSEKEESYQDVFNDGSGFQPTPGVDFENDLVNLRLTKEYSYVNKPIIIEDFLIDNIVYIDDIDISNASEILKDYIVIESIMDKTYAEDPTKINKKNFQQSLEVKLLNKDKNAVISAINSFSKLPHVLRANPEYIYYIGLDSTACDELYYDQWGLIGSYGINIEPAWNFTIGNTQDIIRVGVFEKNLDFNHPDLRVSEGNVTPSNNEGLCHGTHVAGIIGATINNSIGVAGVSQVEIVLLDIYNFKESLRWAYKNDIRIVNASFYFVSDDKGTPAPMNNDDIDAIKDFGAHGGILITSAGNNGDNNYGNTDETPQFPAGYGDARNFPDIDNVISVGAIDSDGSRRNTSNYGINSVQIYAPGGGILSTFPESEWGTEFDDYIQVARGYALASGTSMAAPHVTGVAVLLLSINKNLTVLQLKDAILNSAESMTITIPGDTCQTVKKLNAFNAVKYVLSNYSQATQLKYNTKTLNKSINSTSGYFEEDNFFLKLDVENYYEYEFEISSTNILEVTLYDSGFNNLHIITTNEGYTNQFSQFLFEDEYYLKVNFVDENATGTISVSIIGEPHTHSYTYEQTTSGHIATCACGNIMTSSHSYDAHNCIYCGAYTEMHDYDKNYVWIDYNYHRAQCECGEMDTQPHAISSSAYSNNLKFALCLLCGGRVEKGFVIINANSTLVNKVTINGSFILPSGVIVLEDEDLEAYLNGTLVFYDKNEIPVIK